MQCPLCENKTDRPTIDRIIKPHGKRTYFDCSECRLLFLDPIQRISSDEERRIYEQHENHIDNEGYVTFLKQLIDPLTTLLPPSQKGLDFGSGPGPTLHLIMNRVGHRVKNYDPFFNPDPKLLEEKYDFITATEVIEHFKNPRESFLQMAALLEKKGTLALMTQVFSPQIQFESWWYPKDPTHICFYRVETFHWISRWLGFEIIQPEKNVVFLKKN